MSQTFLKVQRSGQDHYLMEFTGAPSTKTVLSPAIGGPPEQIACAQVCGSLRASMQKALPVVELETWAPVGCAQQGLDSTGQIHEHVAHEEEPGVEGLVRWLPHQAVLWYPALPHYTQIVIFQGDCPCSHTGAFSMGLHTAAEKQVTS